MVLAATPNSMPPNGFAGPCADNFGQLLIHEHGGLPCIGPGNVVATAGAVDDLEHRIGNVDTPPAVCGRRGPIAY